MKKEYGSSATFGNITRVGNGRSARIIRAHVATCVFLASVGDGRALAVVVDTLVLVVTGVQVASAGLMAVVVGPSSSLSSRCLCSLAAQRLLQLHSLLTLFEYEDKIAPIAGVEKYASECDRATPKTDSASVLAST